MVSIMFSVVRLSDVTVIKVRGSNNLIIQRGLSRGNVVCKTIRSRVSKETVSRARYNSRNFRLIYGAGSIIRHGMRRSHETPPRTPCPIPSFRCSSRSHINAGSWLRHGHRHRAARIACPKQSKLYLSSRARPRVDTSGFELERRKREAVDSPSLDTVRQRAVMSIATSRM